MKKIKALLPFLTGSKGLFLVSLLCGTVSTSAKLLIPFLAGKAINELFLGNGDISIYLIFMGVCLALGTLFRYAFDYLTYLIGQRVVERMRKMVFAAYMDASLSSLDKTGEGDLTLRLMSDVENVNSGLVVGFATLYDGIVSIVLTIAFMMSLNYLLGLIVVVLTPLSLLAARFLGKFNSKHFKGQGKKSGELSSYLSETLQGSETIYATGSEDAREAGFDKISREYRDATFKANMGASLINPLTRFVNALVNCAVLMVGASFIAGNWQVGIVFLVGDLSAFLTYASSYTQPFNEVSSVLSEINYAFASFARIETALSLEKDVDQGRKAIENPPEEIRAKDVVFAYDPNERTIIDHVDFSLRRGKSIALVGPTGSGKTTIISLLMRFYDPQEGEFLLDGTSTKDIEKKSLRDRFGMVLQDTWIFHGTAAENIAYGKPEASREEIVEAAKKAGADSFIKRLPQGYDTVVSDSSGLSRGERQLISMARVILMNPDVVLLDEATSSIDVLTEKRLGKSLDALLKGKTSLIVAHRLSTIEHSDLILVLDRGRIVEQGTHAELIMKGGFYAKMHAAQFE